MADLRRMLHSNPDLNKVIALDIYDKKPKDNWRSGNGHYRQGHHGAIWYFSINRFE